MLLCDIVDRNHRNRHTDFLKHMIFRVHPFLMGLLLLLPFRIVAQSTPLITSARTVDSANNRKPTAKQAFVADKGLTPEASASAAAATAAASTAVESKVAAHLLPLFGERSKSTEQIEHDIRFLSDCDQNFSSRQEASQFFAARGWDYINDGQLDTAAYRFNLAYLLNEKNADAYWGLGVVCYQQEKHSDAIRMLKKGLAYADTNTVLMTDLATVEIKFFQQTKNQQLLSDAETILNQAITIDPANATAHIEMSLLWYTKGEYEKAWDALHKARAIDLSVVDLAFLGDLLAKMPDPKGFFKR